MLPPITIPELDPAGPVNSNNDSLLIRQGLNDKRISPANLFSFKLEDYTSLNRPLNATDVLLVGSNNGGGTYTNYIMDPRRVGFLPGVIMWFYTGTAPIYWENVPALADRVLAVQGTSGPYVNVGLGGTWQQENHTLTVAEIPPHEHRFYMSYSSADSDNQLGYPRAGKQNKAAARRARTETDGGGGGPHNHGATWRPAAAIGLVCIKSG